MKHAIGSLSIALLVTCPWHASAQDGVVARTNIDTAVAGPAYWTPERFKAARPLPMPRAPLGTAHAAPASQFAGAPVYSAGAPPTEALPVDGQRLFVPDAARPAAAPVRPGAAGNLGAHFTSTRVFPMFGEPGAHYSADRAYPYRAVGKLFFSANGDPFTCSAAVIQRRVVVTAGHCVHSGSPGGFYQDFVFVPAYRDGEAPFRAWTWRNLVVTATWSEGGGQVPNGADYAMIAFADQSMQAGAPVSRLGNVTGWLSWQTGSLYPNHTSKLGYPCNLDDCEKMQDVTSNSFRLAEGNNVEYGSDAREGSSGGPWVQNFAHVPVGGGTGIDNVVNAVVGVTSYVYNDQAEQLQGASNPDNRWIQLWKTICAQSGNCN
jgi:V8-like Glu-specific endopeptidase